MAKKTDKSNKAEVVIELRDLRKSFGDLEVLKGVNLTARKGEVISLIGSSGSGKSTLRLSRRVAPLASILTISRRSALSLSVDVTTPWFQDGHGCYYLG